MGEGWGLQGLVCKLKKGSLCHQDINSGAVFPVGDRDVHKSQDMWLDQDSHWQQFGTQPILISASQWPHRPCNASTWFYRICKKSSVKAGLAIYNQMVDASGQCISVSLQALIWNSVLLSFCKSSYNNYCYFVTFQNLNGLYKSVQMTI